MSSTIIILLLTIASFGFGIIRDLMMANHLGAGWKTDLFFFALIIPTFIENSIAVSFRDALINYYHQLKSKTQKVSIISWSIILVIGSSIALVFYFLYTKDFWLSILASTWSRSYYNEVNFAFLLGVMTLPLLLWSYFQAAICNINQSFIFPMWRTLLFNAVGLLLFFILDVTTDLMLWALIIGQLLHLILLQVYKRGFFKFSLKSILEIKPPRAFFSIFLSLLIVSFIVQFNLALERIFASNIQEGALSHLTYAYRIITVPYVLFLMSVFSISYSSLSRLYANKEIEEFKQKLNDIVFISLLVMVPISVVFFCVAYDVTKFLLFRGQFNLNDLNETSKAIQGYAIGLPLIVLSFVFSRILIILGHYWQLIIVMLLSSFLVIIFYILGKEYGVLGIALSTSLCALVQVSLIGGYLFFIKYLFFSKKSILVIFLIAIVLYVFFINTRWSGFFDLILAGVLMLLIIIIMLYITNQFSIFKDSLKRLIKH